MNEVIVRQRDMAALRYCAWGVRAFFRRHELDYRAFLRDGIAAAELAATNDVMALAVVEVARGRQQ